MGGGNQGVTGAAGVTTAPVHTHLVVAITSTGL